MYKPFLDNLPNDEELDEQAPPLGYASGGEEAEPDHPARGRARGPGRGRGRRGRGRGRIAPVPFVGDTELADALEDAVRTDVSESSSSTDGSSD